MLFDCKFERKYPHNESTYPQTSAHIPKLSQISPSDRKNKNKKRLTLNRSIRDHMGWDLVTQESRSQICSINWRSRYRASLPDMPGETRIKSSEELQQSGDPALFSNLFAWNGNASNLGPSLSLLGLLGNHVKFIGVVSFNWFVSDVYSNLCIGDIVVVVNYIILLFTYRCHVQLCLRMIYVCNLMFKFCIQYYTYTYYTYHCFHQNKSVLLLYGE